VTCHCLVGAGEVLPNGFFLVIFPEEISLSKNSFCLCDNGSGLEDSAVCLLSRA
jgi:hypothetical protein